MQKDESNTSRKLSTEKKYVVRKVAAKRLKISVRQLANLEKDGKISYHQAVPRGRILYDVDDLVNYLNYHKHKAKFEIYMEKDKTNS